MNDDNHKLIKQIKDYFEQEAINKNNIVNKFSDDIIITAYQKLSANVEDIIKNEEDPVILAETLKSFVETTKLINEKDLPKQQMLLKLFEQLNKYEQSRYY